jgi:predicted nuclease with TOPRIM domain
VIIKCFVFGNSQEQWYKNQMETSVLPSYIQAYNKLQIGVLNELLTVNIASLDDTAVSQLANRLYCAVRETYTFLQQSISASQTLQDQVNVRLTSSLLQRSTYERNIADTENEIVQTNQALEGAINQLAVAENAVLEKQRAVAAADQVVRDAEDDVERARKCRGKRGGWISKITRPIVRPIENIVKDVIIKPICSVINEGGVSSAKSRRNDAESQLASARNQEQHYRQIVNEKAQLKNNLLNQLHEFQSSLFAIRAELEILQKEYSATANINTQVDQMSLLKTNIFFLFSLVEPSDYSIGKRLFKHNGSSKYYNSFSRF